MPTGFEKFSKRALQEEPINITRKAEEKKEEKVDLQPVRTEPQRQPAAKAERPVEQEVRRRGRPKKVGRDTEGLITVTIQMNPDTKTTRISSSGSNRHTDIWTICTSFTSTTVHHQDTLSHLALKTGR